MKKCAMIVLAIILSSFLLKSYADNDQQPETTSPSIASVLGKLPTRFEANHGQTDREVKFLARGSGYTLFLTPTETVLSLRKFNITRENKGLQRRAERVKAKYKNVTRSVLRMKLVGANPQARVSGIDELSGKVNYFMGNDPTHWLSNVPVFGKVKYEQAYPGIDLIYYGDEGRLEYDFIVAPGANPTVIEVEFQGAHAVELDGEGNLVAQLSDGAVLWRKPIAYQEIDGARRLVPVEYLLNGQHRFGFRAGNYDTSRPLIIDPVLGYSTYLGGTSDDSARGIAVDARGFAYVTGDTSSSDFPVIGNSKLNGFTAAFVTKLSPGGSNMVFSTYLGSSNPGADFDSGQGIAVDKGSNVYVVGFTDSTRFPTVNAYQSSLRGADDVFFTKLNPSGSIVYSTYLGGTNDQTGYAVAVDTNGNAYVTGDTMSDNFPTKSAFQSVSGGTDTPGVVPLDAFVAKFNPNSSGSSSLIYSTYLGAEDDDSGQAIAVDTSGNAYVTGYTYSTNFPTTVTAIQTQITFFVDAFVAKLGPTGSNLLYSTCLGGDDADIGAAIALDTNRIIYIAGYTGSANFPVTATAFQPVFGTGFQNAFISSLNISLPGTNALLYSTYLGGNDGDAALGIAVDSNRFVYVAGYAGSTDFPTTPGAFQRARAGGFDDAFVAKLNPAASGKASLIYSTYLGGRDDDFGYAIAVDSTGNAYVAGETVSTNFPATLGAVQTTLKGFFDAFVAKIIPAADVGLTLSRSPNPAPLGGTLTYTVVVTNNGELAATSVALTNTLPSQVAFVSSTATMGSCSQAGGVVTCNFGTMSSGAGVTVTITTTANTPGTATDIAKVTHGEADGNPANNVATNVTTIGSIVSVSATATNALEAGPVPGTYRFSRTGYINNSVTVNYTVGGTATPGLDYFALNGSVTFNIGQSVQSVIVSPIDDNFAECDETVVVTISPDANYAIGSPTNATITIIDNNDLPQVNVVGTTPNASEAGPSNGVFTVSRIACTSTALTVNYTVSGTATPATDYNTLSGTVTIPVGALSQTINVVPMNDSTPECPETVVLTISPNAAYAIGPATNATVTINDNDLPSVTIVATTPSASEALVNGVFTVTRNGCLTSPLTVTYTVGGTAINGTDYSTISNSVTIPASQNSATITISPFPDDLVESNETVVLTLTAGAGYSVGSPGSATVNIADVVGPPTASFTGSPTSALIPFTVTFTDTSVGSIANRFWDFGDGTTTNVTRPGVTHTYTVEGSNTVVLTVSGSQGSNTQTRPNYIIAIDLPPQLSVTPASQNFGTLTIGQTRTQTFSVANAGGGTLNGTASVPAPFSVVSGGSYSLTSTQTGTVAVAFIPTSAGTFNANVTFSSNGGTSNNAVNGIGLTPGSIQVSPATVNFGPLVTGTTAQVTMIVTNQGGTAVTNGSATITGGPFTVLSGNPFSVAGFGSTNVVVRFAPLTAGVFTNSIIFGSANGGTRTNTLIGEGAAVPIASFTAVPTNGTTPLVVTFTNTSAGTITNSFWNFGDNVTSNTTATILTHTYAAGSFTVTLIASGPAGVSTNIKANLIRAFNPANQIVTPANRDYGAVTIGQTNIQSFSVSNTGDLPLTGTVTVPSPYFVTNNPSYTVNAGQAISIGVSFIPTTPGTFNANVIFNSNGGISTNPVAGVGLTAGQIGVSPVTLHFGTIATGTTSQGIFTVSNNGGTPVTNGVATVTGGPYTILSGATFTIPAGSSTNVVVQFAPVSVGGFTNTVIFTTANGGVSTNAVVGSGATVPSASFTATPTNGTAPLTVTFTNTSSGTITNNLWNFGDNTTSNTPATILTHTYAAAGTYSVSLVVNGPLGVSTSSTPNLIRVLNPAHLVVNPNSRDFGSVTIGQTSTLSFSVINTGDLTLTGTASAPSPFGVTPATSSYSVLAGQTGTVQVTFAPTSASTFNANVVLDSNGGGSTNALSGVGLTPGDIGVSPPSISFGTIATGTTMQAVFVVSNTGGTPVSNGVATVGAPFSIVAGNTFSVAAGGSTNITVRFAPTSVGTFSNSVLFTSANGGSNTNPVTGAGAAVPMANFSGSPTNGAVPLTVNFNDTSGGTITNRFWSFGDGATLSTASTTPTHTYGAAGSYTVRLIVSGPLGASTNTRPNYIVGVNPPDLNVTPLSLDFGAVTIGETNTLSFSIINSGDLPLMGTATASSPFSIGAGSSPYTVQAGGTGTVQVSFIPTSPGAAGGNIVFASNGGNSTNALLGTGLMPGQIGVSPVALNFGTIAIGTTSQRVFTVTNGGGTTVSNGVATVTGGPYTIVSGGSFDLGPGASTNVVVRFAPTAGGAFTNSVIINTDNGGDSTNSVIGAGATVPSANFTAAPTNGVAPLSVTFSNASSGTITNALWSFGDNTTSNTLASVLSHTYTDAGAYSVRLIASGPLGASTNNKPNLIVVVNPPQLDVTPTSRNFGSVTIGLTNSLTFSVANTGDLPLSGTATTAAPFVMRAGSPYTVAPGQTQLVTIAFAPTAAGTFNANVIFNSNGGESTNAVSGVGQTPGQIGVNPPTLSFGIVPTGTTSPRVFTVTNSGGTTVSNGLAAVTGGPFTIVSGSPFSLPAGASTNVVVQFAPTNPGGFTNAVIFTSANGGNSTNAIAGSSAIPTAASFSATPTNGTTPLTVTFNDTSTGTITNRAWDFGDGTTTNATSTSLTHVYVSGGTYTVTLTVSGPLGDDTDTRSNLIVALDPPHLVVNPSSRDFGAVTMGQTNNQPFVVINTGDLTLTGSATVGGAFAISSGSPFTVAGGQTQTVVVSFRPVAAGTFSNEVVFTSNGGASTNDVIGVGLMPGQLGVSPVARDFGTIATGTTSQAVFTVSNSGGVTISNGTAVVTGGPFSIVSGSTFSLAAGSSTNVIVRFAPLSIGAFTSTVVFTSANGGNSTNPVTGAAAIVPVASFTATPTNGAWPLTVTFTDTSTGTITNRFWDFGDGATIETQTNVLTHTYNTPGSNDVTLIVSGPVGVSTNARLNLIVVVNPPNLVVTPATRNFGSVTIGLTNSQTFSVINSGDQSLIGTATTPAPFAVIAGGSYNVGGGKTQTVTVSFIPTTTGAFSNAVVFTSNGGVSTNAVTGTGLTPGQLGVSPVALDFGVRPTGTSTQGTFVVTNSGQTTVTNGIATVTGGPFTIVSGSSFSLPGGASTNVTVNFAPVTENSFTNAVIFSSANGGSLTNRISGTGASVPVAGFSGTPTTGAAPLDVTFTDTSTGTITNRSWNFGDGSTTNTASTSFTHRYNLPGTNTVTLTVSGPLGSSTLPRTNYIVAVKPPKLVVTPTNRDFGALTMGLTNSQSFSVINQGELALNGTATTAGPFAVGAGSPFTVTAGQTQIVTITFAPTSTGTFSNNVIFASNGGASTNPVIGVGLTPGQIGVSPVNLNLGTILVGTTTQGVFTVSNGGGTPVSNGTATVSAPFTIVSGQQFSVPPFGSTNVLVRFTASGAGGFTNSILFATANGGSSTNTVIASSTAPPSASFSASPTSGAAPLDVTFSDSSTGTITNRFWNFGDGLTTNTTSTSFVHRFSVPGTNTVSLTVTGPVGGPSTQTRTNYIVVVRPAQLVVTPSSRNFGTVAVGQTNNQTFSAINIGDLSLTGTATAASPFAVIPGSSSYTVGAGQTQTVTVSFIPQAVGTFSNNVIFASNGGASTNAVTGTGAALPVASFSGTPTTGPAPLDVTFTDTSTGTITNRSWSFGDGTTTNTLATTVVHRYITGGRNTVSLTVRGPVGQSTMTLTNYIVALNPPQLIVNPTSLNFGAVVTNRTSTLSFAVSNGGDLPLNGSATVGGAFTIVGGSPFAVAAGQTQSVTVSFTPSALSAFSNAVVFSSNGGASTNAVTGSGVPPLHLVVAPQTVTLAEGGTATFTVVLSEQPSGDIAVDVTKEPGGDASLSVSPAALTFTSANWDQPQAVIVSAAPDSDSVSGSAVFTVSSPTIQGSMQVMVTAVDAQRFTPLVGTYYGLIESNTPSHATSGFVTFSVTASGALKGKLIFAGAKLSCTGQFDAEDKLHVAIARLNAAPLTLDLHVDTAGGSEQITGAASDGSFASQVLANRAVFNSTSRPAPQAGMYTIVLPANSNATPATEFPQGDGFGLITIDAGGRAKLAGISGDGNKFKQSLAVSKYGTLPVYVLMYRGTGSMFGWVTVTNIVGVSDLSGPVNWFKPRIATDVFYPNGFAVETDLLGSKYQAPPPGVPTSGFADGVVIIGGGNLETNIVKNVAISDTGGITVQNPGADNLTMKLSGKSGQFSGSFVHPATGSPAKFKGALIQKQNLGGGNFRGVDQTGFVTLEPAN